MSDVIEAIRKLGIVPVVKIMDAKDAAPLARALVAGDLPVAEITFRTSAAEAAIAAIHREAPEVLLGAGTVLDLDQVKRAVDAGAQFIVSPGLNPSVVGYCVKQGIPCTPGINNPTGIEAALDLGVRVLKFFPAEASGGLKMLEAMAAPYGEVKFIPTGGVNAANIGSYLASEKVLACGGTWICKASDIAAGGFDAIAAAARNAVARVVGFRLDSMRTEDSPFSACSGVLPLGEGEAEILIITASLERARAYFDRKGIPCGQDTSAGFTLEPAAGGIPVRIAEERS